MSCCFMLHLHSVTSKRWHNGAKAGVMVGHGLFDIFATTFTREGFSLKVN